jgi:hypothetical protein
MKHTTLWPLPSLQQLLEFGSGGGQPILSDRAKAGLTAFYKSSLHQTLVILGSNATERYLDVILAP